MIFPYLAGILSPLRAPVTYLLLAINLFVFFGTYKTFESSDAQLDQYLDDRQFLTTQGAAFAVMIGREPRKFSPTLQSMAKSSEMHDQLALEALGGFALRNPDFMSRAQTFNFGGDEIAVETWRKKLLAFQKVQDLNPSFRWGVSQLHNSWTNWVSYQFSHAGFAHLFWNMVFLMIFGCFVEVMLGGAYVAVAYVAGGLVGAWAYSCLSGISYSPLVGASGAISGLIGLVAVAWWRAEKLPFLYVLIPVREYMGITRLPSWLLALVFLLPDLSHYVASSREVGSVAYSAHLGGAAFGAMIAAGILLGWLPKKKTAPELQVPLLLTGSVQQPVPQDYDQAG